MPDADLVPKFSAEEVATTFGKESLESLSTLLYCSPVMTYVKRRKMDDAYENLSKDELLSRVRDLEKEVQSLKNPKPTPAYVAETNESNTKRPMDFSKYRKRHIALKFLYLGWDYHGLVVQDNTVDTIEDHMFKALTKGRLIEDRASSNYHRCGRTDRGVSSFSQVISLTVRSRLEEGQDDAEELPYCKIINSLLPSDIRVVAWSPVPDSFSARFSCKSRTYKYWFPRGTLNIEAMDRAAKQMIGVHDFRNLCKMDVVHGVTNFTRQVFHAEISEFRRNSTSAESAYDMYHLVITAKGFLWHQIRCILSILLLVGQGKEDVDIVRELLDVEKHPRKPEYGLASPLPLNLYSCEFDEVDWNVDQQIINSVIQKLQSHWASEAIKTSMLENMLQDCSLLSAAAPKDLVHPLLKDNHSGGRYRPLFSRQLAQSLDDRISYYVQKGRLRPDIQNKSTTENTTEK